VNHGRAVAVMLPAREPQPGDEPLMDNDDETTSPRPRAASREWRLSFLASVERRRRDALAILLGAWCTDHAIEPRIQYEGTDQ